MKEREEKEVVKEYEEEEEDALAYSVSGKSGAPNSVKVPTFINCSVKISMSDLEFSY